MPHERLATTLAACAKKASCMHKQEVLDEYQKIGSGCQTNTHCVKGKTMAQWINLLWYNSFVNSQKLPVFVKNWSHSKLYTK